METTERKSIFKKVAAAKASRSGNFFRDGKGRVIVKKLALFESSESGGMTFVAEFIVKESKKVAVVSSATGQPLDITPNEPGSSVSVIYQHLESKNSSGPANVAAFFEALMGPEFEDLDEDAKCAEMDEAVEKQSAAGLELGYETARKLTKEKKVEIVIPNFSHVENTQEMVQANRELLAKS